MFAYCLNNPMNCVDHSGRIAIVDDLTAVACLLVVVLVYVGIEFVVISVINEGLIYLPFPATYHDEIFERPTYASPKREVYQYRDQVQIQAQQQRRRTPHVHHIVPVGSFINRSLETRKYLYELHALLSDRKINCISDPMNLMVVSAEFHATLHTDAYIKYVYDTIMATDGSKHEIYAALFWLRIEIAAADSGAVGY